MVLADAEGIDAEPVGQHRLLDHLADDLGVAVEAAVGTGGDIAECIEPEFHWAWRQGLAWQARGCSEIRIVAGAFAPFAAAPGSIAEGAGPTAMLKSKRGAAISDASRDFVNPTVIRGKMMKSGPVR